MGGLRPLVRSFSLTCKGDLNKWLGTDENEEKNVIPVLSNRPIRAFIHILPEQIHLMMAKVVQKKIKLRRDE